MVLLSSDWVDHGRKNRDIIDKIASNTEKNGTSLPVSVQGWNNLLYICFLEYPPNRCFILVYSLPWKDEVVLRVMKDLETAVKYEKSMRMKKFVVRAAFGDVGTLLHAIPVSDVDIDDEPLF